MVFNGLGLLYTDRSLQIVYCSIMGAVMLAALLEWFLWLVRRSCGWDTAFDANNWTGCFLVLSGQGVPEGGCMAH